MKKILILSIGFCLITAHSAIGQVLNDSGLHGRMTLQTKEGTGMNGLEGSPFENEEFQAGQITLEGNKPVTAFLRYDVVNDVMEIKTERNGTDIYILPNKKNTEYTIGQHRYLYKSLKADEKLLEGYFKEYYNGEKVSLYQKLSSTITEPRKAQTGYQKDKPAQIIIQDNYYLAFPDGTVEDVKLKEKDFKNALPESKAVNTYFSENKAKDLEDFIKFLDWYNKQV